jgi:hypothetical protein
MIIVMNSLASCRQGPEQLVSDYIDRIRTIAETIEHHGGSIGDIFISAMPDTDAVGTAIPDDERRKQSRACYLSALCIQNADKVRYGTLLAHLANQYLLGHNEYPTDLTEAQSLLNNYQTPTNTVRRVPPTVTTRANAAGSVAATFTQTAATPTPGSDGRLHPDIRCYQCQSFGHYSQDCPTRLAPAPSTTGTTLLQHAFIMAQHDHAIDPNWILLDSQSTISVFKNPAMLTNIRNSGRVLRANTNGGFQDSTQVGDFPNLGEVWYNPDSIANILSLADVCRVRRVTMDSATNPAITVHRKDGSLMHFTAHPSGLYVFNANDSSSAVTAYTLVNTVAEQKKLFTPRQVQDADKARDLYRLLGRPSEADFQRILRNNYLHNCPVTPTDAARALTIYGKDVPFLKGTTTHRPAASRVPTFTAVAIPPPVLAHHRDITICADFFYVQKILFLHTISRNLGYRTVLPVPDRSRDTMLSGLTEVIHTYTTRGFTVRDIHADHEFECVRSALLPIVTDIVPADSHVGEIERSIRTIKERVRSCAHGLPFKRLPKLLIQHLVAHATICLNQFPWVHGVSRSLSPASIVTGVPPPDFNKLRIEFGSYVQVFEANNPTNTPKARSVGAIALTPTGNANGDYYFLSLASGSCLSRHQWDVLPINDTVIARVEAMAAHEGQPLLQDSGLVIEWRPDFPVDPDEYDRDYTLPDVLPADDFSDDDYDPIDEDELHALGAAFEPAPPPPGPPQGAEQHPDHDDDAQPQEQLEPAPAHDDDNEPAPAHADDDDELAFPAHDLFPLQEITDEEDYEEPPPGVGAQAPEEGAHALDDGAPLEAGAQTDGGDGGAPPEEGAPAPGEPRYNLRERNAPRVRFRDVMDAPHGRQSYDTPVQLMQQGIDAQCKYIFGWVMNQMTAKAGIKKHGELAEIALLKEFSQHRDLDVWEILDPLQLTHDQKMNALRALNLLKEKRNGDLKGRTVADGSKQKGLYPRSETASPTVSTIALILTILIDAYERRDVATADVAGAYLKATMNDYVLIKFTGESVDILLKMEPSYEKFVTYEKGVKVLYARLKKALYGCVQSALLWYNLFHDTLKSMGFKVNPYDPCVANCMIDGSQCTIAWYVDDTKISHVNPDVVTGIIYALEGHFGKMTVTRGPEHVFLGMNILYTKERTAEITMKPYLQEAIDDYLQDITYEAATPAKRDLFEVDERATRLTKHAADNFHSISMKLLYVAIRARMDILLPVGFLATRVSKSTIEDQAKLQRVLEYVRGTMNETYTIGADNLTTLRTWIDASFAVHPDMKSHTGGIMSYGRGGFGSKSTKQKVNVKSSTHAELVGVSDYLPNTIWVTRFMTEQGYPPKENFLEQDNESAMKLEVNGRTSAGAKSRHLDIQYFWVKENLESLGIKVRHCRTLKMLGDFYTKPLQGKLFKVFRDVALGKLSIAYLDQYLDHLLEERVGESRQDGRGTDDKAINKSFADEEGFILVKSKEKDRRKYVERYVTASGSEKQKSEKIVSSSLS